MSDIFQIINEFRRQNGRPPVRNYDKVVSDYCFAHCLSMSRRGDLYHAEPCYLCGWREAVAMCSYSDDFEGLKWRMIFEILGGSPPHRALLLDCDTIAYAIFTHNYSVYLTIRGR